MDIPMKISELKVLVVMYFDNNFFLTDLLSPTAKIAMFSASGRSLLAIPGLSDKEAYVDQPWQKLYDIVRLAGTQLGWDMGNLFSTAW